MPLWPHSHTQVPMEGRIKKTRDSFTKDLWLGFVHLLKEYDEGMLEHMKHTTFGLHAIYLPNTHKSGVSLMRFDNIHHGVNVGDNYLPPIGDIWSLLSPPIGGDKYNYLQSGTFGRSAWGKQGVQLPTSNWGCLVAVMAPIRGDKLRLPAIGGIWSIHERVS